MLQEVQAHIGIIGNEMVDQLANDKHLAQHTPTPHYHIAHTTPSWLNGVPIGERNREICNLHGSID